MPSSNKEHVLLRILGTESTRPGWEYDIDRLWNQQDEAIPTDTCGDFVAVAGSYQQSHDVS